MEYDAGDVARAPMDLIEAADAAPYAAKHRGRNAVVEHGLVRVGMRVEWRSRAKYRVRKRSLPRAI